MNSDSEPYSYSSDHDIETFTCKRKYKPHHTSLKPHRIPSLHKPHRYTLSQKASIGQAPIPSIQPTYNPLRPQEQMTQQPTYEQMIQQRQQEQHDFQIQVQSQRRRQLSDQIDEYRIQLSNLHEDRQNILTQIQHYQRQINALNDNLQRNIIPDINTITQTIDTLEQELRNT
jgi:DNA repair exonuclease SbcCD ATPase subunit